MVALWQEAFLRMSEEFVIDGIILKADLNPVKATLAHSRYSLCRSLKY